VIGLSLVQELKRRGVVRVVLAYLAGAWLLLQIADLALPAYGFSDEAMALLINIVVIGVVPAAILAWVFEWTPDGIARDTGRAVPAANARRMDRAIIVVLLLAVSYFVVDKFWLRPAVELEIDRSIAVLPFVNMSSDPEQDYFSDGISEEILNLLAKVQELRVISRSSAFAYRGRDVNIPEVAEALNVAYVLEGSVRKAGDRIRITAQLIEAATDKHLWSDTYDRDLEDIFAIQDEVSAKIIDQLKIELTGDAPHAYRTDPETYAMFLRAKSEVLKKGYVGDPETIPTLEAVIERDPDYVPALTYLVEVLVRERSNFGDKSMYAGEIGERKIRELLDRALAVDPNSAIAVVQKAWSNYRQDLDISAVGPMIGKALRLAPNDVQVLQWARGLPIYLGDHDSTSALLKRAVEIDPACLNCLSAYARALRRAGRLDEAESVARRRDTLAPGGKVELALISAARGDYEKATEYAEQVENDRFRLNCRAIVALESGDMALFESLKSEAREKYGSDMDLRALSGDKEAWFEEGYDYYKRNIGFFGLELWHERNRYLHGDPRWEELRELAGLTDEDLAGIEFNLPEGF
jgi:TolB-like protein/Tfp pilus assembly protein PilF